MFLDILPEERQVAKSQVGGNLLDGHVAVEEQLLDVAHHALCDEPAGGLVGVLVTDAGQILGRDAELVGIGLDAATLLLPVGQQEHKAPVELVALAQHGGVVELEVPAHIAQDVIDVAAQDADHGLFAEVQFGMLRLELG